MDTETLKSRLRNEIGIHSEIIALKQTKEEPAGIEAYGDMNHICYMMGEVLEEGRTFYTTLQDHVCILGCAATGLDPSLQALSAEQQQESQEFHVGSINIFPTEALQAKAEKEAGRLFPKFTEVSRAIIMGPWGSFVKGYAGMGVCRMLLPHAFLMREPTYTVSDRAWRRALNLSPDQLTLVAPPDKLIVMLETLEASKKQGA
jgi:hypothetical protein